MGQLGNIYEDEQQGGGGERGADLHVDVEVPPHALGNSDGFRAHVPLDLDHEGSLRHRADPHGEGDTVLLRLPDSLPKNAVLKLRGQGAECPEGRAGDLFVRVIVTKSAIEAKSSDGEAAHGLGWIGVLVFLAIAGSGIAVGWVLTQ